MKQSSPNSQAEFFKSIVPKARPPIRNVNIPERNDFWSLKNSENLLVKKNMYKTRQHSLNLSNLSNYEIQYTDDEDDSDDKNNDSSINSNELLSNSSQNLLLDSFNTADNYSFTTEVHKRSSHSPNTSRFCNITHNSVSSTLHDQPKERLSTKHSNVPLYSSIGIVLLILVLIVQVVVYKVMNQEKMETEAKPEKLHIIEVDKMLDKSMQLIQTQFYNQKPNIWNDISAAIYDVILYPKKPSIIILFGNEANTLHCLAQLLGQLSGIILGSNNHLILTPEDFPNDVGQVIYDLKTQILQKQAIIIQDLLNINTEAIKAFHNFCDKNNPLVEHAIYIITMIVDDYKPPHKELEFVEKKLIKRLSGKIEKDILDPLVTRITDGSIIPVLPESNTSFNHTDCSFPTNQVDPLMYKL